MKKINTIKLSILVASLVVLSSCFWDGDISEKSQGKPEAALYVVNVLSQELYDDAHIKGSIQLDLNDLDTVASQWNKQAPVVFYCSNYHCTASSHAARQFKKAGFEHVYAYEGGMAEWYQLGKQDASYVTEGPATESYLTQEIPAPEHEKADIEIIAAADLKAKMHYAGLL